jgi:hypothetical protein
MYLLYAKKRKVYLGFHMSNWDCQLFDVSNQSKLGNAVTENVCPNFV